MLALGECGRICGQRNAACFIAAAALANVSSLGVADYSKQPQISRMLMQWRIEYARCESVFLSLMPNSWRSCKLPSDIADRSAGRSG